MQLIALVNPRPDVICKGAVQVGVRRTTFVELFRVSMITWKKVLSVNQAYFNQSSDNLS